MEGKRIAIFGGSFNPIQLGHVNTVKHLLKYNWCDEVCVMVSPDSPLKQHHPEMLPYNIRLELARKTFADMENVVVSDFEDKLPKPSYSVNLFRALRQEFPQHVFSFAVGNDVWDDFDNRDGYDEILYYHPFLICPRPENNINPFTLPKNVYMVCSPIFDVSSTDVRNNIKKGKDITGMVPENTKEEVVELYNKLFNK